MKTMAMTATTYIISRGLLKNMKNEALELAEFYENNIKIEININKANGLAKFNITEYNL